LADLPAEASAKAGRRRRNRTAADRV